MTISTLIADLTSKRALKLWAAFGGIVSIVLSANILPEQYRLAAESVLAFLTSVGVYAVPNATVSVVAPAPTLDRGTTKG